MAAGSLQVCSRKRLLCWPWSMLHPIVFVPCGYTLIHCEKKNLDLVEIVTERNLCVWILLNITWGKEKVYLLNLSVWIGLDIHEWVYLRWGSFLEVTAADPGKRESQAESKHCVWGKVTFHGKGKYAQLNSQVFKRTVTWLFLFLFYLNIAR